MATRTLQVVIAGDASGAKRAFAETEKAAGGFRQRMAGVSKSMARFGTVATVGMTLPIIVGFKSIAGAASDLNETNSKVGVVFGKNADEIRKWSTTTAKSLGISQQASLDFAGSLGNVFTQLGVTTDQAATMSTAWVDLAGDLASFQNADPTQILEAMSAATRGEYDALQRFAPAVTAAAIEQKALALTGKTATDALTNQEKVLALNKLMFEQTTAAQGDFARTADQAANKQRVLNAQFEDMKAKLGTALLPILTDLATKLSSLVDWFTKLDPKWQKVVLGAAAFLAVVGPLATAIGGLVAVVGFLLSPVGLAIVAIAALAAGLVYAYQNSEDFRRIVDSVAKWLLTTGIPAAQDFAQKVTAAFQSVSEWVHRNWPQIQQVIQTVMGHIAAVTSFFLNAISVYWDNFGRHIVDNIARVMRIVQGVVAIGMNLIRGVVQIVTSIIRGDWSAAWDAVLRTTQRVFSGIVGVVQNAVGVIRNLISMLANIIRGAFDGVAAAVGRAAQGVKDAWNSAIGGRGVSIPGFDPPGPGPSFGGFEMRIPRLHDGGVFRAPRAGGEGLALLKDRETVLPAGAGRTLNQNISIRIDGSRDANATAQAIVAELDRYERAFAGGTASPE